MAAPPSLFDVAVIGIGAHGSAAVYQLSKVPNLKVLGIEQFSSPHIYGSSHGETRITRQIYFEHPDYVPLVKKSYPMWRDLENEAKTQLFVNSGGIYIGQEGYTLMNGLKRTAKEHNFDIKPMKAREIMERFPAFKVPDNMVGIYDPTAGILFPEKCIEAFIAGAEKRGATINFGEKVTDIVSESACEKIVTNRGVYRAKKVIITVGAYATVLLKQLNLPLKVEKKKIFWVEPVKEFAENFKVEKMPIYMIEDEVTKIQLYGFPNILGTGVKSALHVNKGEYIQDVYKVDRTVDEKDVENFKEKISVYLPKAFGKLNKSSVCMYTMTPDEHFIIDFLPKNKNIILASPCSGHGFKFCIIVGEILKDLAVNGKSEFDLRLFALNRNTLINSKL